MLIADPFSSSSSSLSSSNRFQTLPSEDGDTPKRFASVEPSRVQTPNNPFATSQAGQIDPTALVPYFNQSIQNANSNGSAGSSGSGMGTSSAPPLSPNSATAAASAFNLDPALLQTSIGSLLQSPAAAQMFLNSLTHSAQGQALSTPRGSVNFGAPASGSNSNPNQLQNQQNNYFANLSNNPFDGGSAGGTGFTPQADPTLALLSPLPNYQALAQNNEALLKSYEDAMAIGGDAEKLQEGIDSLVRSLGLQPTDGGGDGLANPGTYGGNNYVNGGAAGATAGSADLGGSTGTGGTGGSSGQDAQPGDLGFDNDFNVDDFLERLGNQASEEH